MRPEILYAGTISCPHWLRWLGHLQDQPATGMELGTFRGYSAKWMVENIFTHPDSEYYCVDTFQGSMEHRGDATIDWAVLEAGVRAYLAPHPQIIICKSRSADWLKTCRKKFDFIYVDASHVTRDALRDAVLAFDLLKIGGVMIFDDYLWAVMADPLDRPKIAIDAFLACYAKQIEILEKSTQVCIKKTHED